MNVQSKWALLVGAARLLSDSNFLQGNTPGRARTAIRGDMPSGIGVQPATLGQITLTRKPPSPR